MTCKVDITEMYPRILWEKDTFYLGSAEHTLQTTGLETFG
jgi:hypothetical protein